MIQPRTGEAGRADVQGAEGAGLGRAEQGNPGPSAHPLCFSGFLITAWTQPQSPLR